MELMIKMSAAEADEAMAKGLIQALVYPFSCREEVRRAAEKPAEKPEEVKKEEAQEAITSMPQRKNIAAEPEQKPAETEQEAPKAEQKPAETEQAEKDESKYTLDQLSKAAADLITSNAESQTKLLELLKKFNVESLPELKPENYTEFGEELKAVGGKL